MKTRLNVVRITVISTVILGAAMLITWSSTAAPKTGLDMWGVEHRIPDRGWALFDFVHSAGCGYCVLNAKAYQENFADGLSAAGVTTFGVDVFEEQRDLVDYVKHNRIRFPILTEPDALWAQLRCPGLPGQSLFHDGRPVLSRSETLTYLNYDRIRDILRSDDLANEANEADGVQPFRPVGPLKKALNCVYEDENALLIVGDSFETDARRFFPDLKRVVFRTKRASEVTDSDLGKGAVYVVGSPAENAFLGRLRGKTPFEVRGDGIAFADTLLEGDDLTLWYCYTNPWNPERYLVVKTGTYPVRGEKLGYDGSQDFFIGRRLDSDQDRQGSLIVARGKFAKAGGEWSLPEREIDWEQAPTEAPAAPMVACGADGCPMPTPSTHTRQSPSGDDDSRRGDAGDRDELFASSALELEAPVSWPGRFPALASAADTACWVAWDQPQGGIFVARLGDDVWGPQRVWVGESAVGDAADLLGTDDVDAYKPSVLSDGTGRCWVTWSQLDRGYYQVFAARVPVDGPPETWRISHRVNLDHHAPAIARSGDGTVTLTWYAWEANARRPYYRQWNGRRWSSVGRVSTQDESQFAWYLSGTAGRGGNGRWVWMQHYPSPTSIVTATVANTGWGKPETITDAGRYPSIAFDPHTGETRVAWQQWMRGGTKSTRNEWRILTSSSGGAGWSGPEPIPGCPPGRNATPVIAVDGAGRTWVFWSHKGHTDGSDNGGSEQRNWRILCSVFDTSRWQGPFAISDPRSDARSPAVASSGGSMWISWHRGTGTDLQIVVRTIRPVKSSSGEAAPEAWATSGQTNN